MCLWISIFRYGHQFGSVFFLIASAQLCCTGGHLILTPMLMRISWLIAASAKLKMREFVQCHCSDLSVASFLHSGSCTLFATLAKHKRFCLIWRNMQINVYDTYQKALRRQRLYFGWTTILAGRPIVRIQSCMPVRGVVSAKCFACIWCFYSNTNWSCLVMLFSCMLQESCCIVETGTVGERAASVLFMRFIVSW